MTVPSNLIPTRISQLPDSPVASEDGLLVYVYNGITYKIRAGDLLQVAGVPTSRNVFAGTGLTGGGPLSSDVTISIAPGGVGTSELASSGVTPGQYGTSTQVPVVTVDSTGRVTSVTTATVDTSGGVPTTRQVIAGTGLTGGGPLSSDVTLDAALSDSTPLGLSGTGSSGVSTSMARSDHQHPAVDLADDTQVDGLLGLDHGGTARSLVPVAGAFVWSGADGLYVGTAGQAGQVPISGGSGEYTWGSVITATDQPANYVYAGPTSGPDGPTGFRNLVNADLPVVDISHGGTGATTAPDALTALGAYPASNPAGYTSNTGTVSSVSVVSANGFGGTVATATSTPAITLTTDLTGLLKGNGTAMSAAVAGTDYAVPGANGDITSLTGLTGGISTPDFVQFDTGITPSLAVGKLQWDPDYGTLQVGLAGGNVNLQVGQETVLQALNKTGSPLLNGKVVKVTGAQGQRTTVDYAQANTELGSGAVLGILTEDIANNQQGYVTTDGLVHGLDTSLFAEGAPLYLSTTVAGDLTDVAPVAPNHLTLIGFCVKSHAVDGHIYVHVQVGYELDELHDVKITSATNTDLLQYYGAGPYWRNVQPSTVSVGGLTVLTNAGDLAVGTGSGTIRLGIGGANTVLHGGTTTPVYSAVVEADISLSANTTNDVTTARHGFCPVLPNNATLYLNGQGNYTLPSGLTISASYSATAFSGQTSVSVTHNFGTYPIVQVVDNTGAVLIPLSITNNTINDFTVTFNASTTGTIMASVGSPQPQALTTVAAATYTALTTDRIIKVTSSGCVVSLFTSVGNTGRELNIVNASTGNITVDPSGSQTINNQLTQVIPPSSAMTIFADGSNWWII